MSQKQAEVGGNGAADRRTSGEGTGLKVGRGLRVGQVSRVEVGLPSPAPTAPAAPPPPVGLLDNVRNVSHGVAIQRNALEASWEALRQSTIEAARRVAELDAQLARAAANQEILQAKRDALDSLARRKLRTQIWRALTEDCGALESHEGRRRLALAWIVSVTADEERNWSADLWLPVAHPLPVTGPALDVWEAAVQACTHAMLDLHGPGPGPEVISAKGLSGLRITPPLGCSREASNAALVRSMDRTRVQAVPLHQLRLEVSVVWLDVAVAIDGPPTRLSGTAPEDMDTLVGEAVDR